MNKISFIGLGNMGTPMVSNLLKHKYDVKVFDINKNNYKPFKKTNAIIVEKKQELREPVNIDPKYKGKKMSRNEPCFCGSGKKYKRCCGAL